jgi:DUF971 family protein
VGRYAIVIHWSDGHNTGIYTWEHLYELGQNSPGFCNISAGLSSKSDRDGKSPDAPPQYAAILEKI